MFYPFLLIGIEYCSLPLVYLYGGVERDVYIHIYQILKSWVGL
jgi:hypothetical protein